MQPKILSLKKITIITIILLVVVVTGLASAYAIIITNNARGEANPEINVANKNSGSSTNSSSSTNSALSSIINSSSASSFATPNPTSSLNTSTFSPTQSSSINNSNNSSKSVTEELSSTNSSVNIADLDTFENGVYDEAQQIDRLYNKTLFQNDELTVTTSSTKKTSSQNDNGWVGNLSINSSLLNKKYYTYASFNGEEFYIGPSVKYVANNGNLWYLAVQTGGLDNEYTLFKCEFGCKKNIIIIQDAKEVIVNVNHTKILQNLSISTIPTNDKFALPEEKIIDIFSF